MTSGYLRVGTPQELSTYRPRHCEGMCGDDLHAADNAVGLVENAELPEHRGAVVINLLACEPILAVERENTAQRKSQRTPGWAAARATRQADARLS
jgi:hypothetical protein